MKIEVIRSAKRRKTISARLEGDTLVVRAPADLPEAELQRAITRLQARVLKKQARRQLSDEDLQQRAQMLNDRYFGGKLRWRSIRWVSNQNKRFGSCTPKKKTIRISHRVGKMPQWVQDYVIIHEMAHLLEANHSAAFWRVVERYPLCERARGYLMALGMDDDAAPTQAEEA